MRWDPRFVVVLASLALVVVTGCASNGASDCVGSTAAVTCPSTIRSGTSAEVSGMHLGPGTNPITFTDSAGHSLTAVPNFGDDVSQDVNVPEGLTPGVVTITVFNGTCNVRCSTTLM